MDRLWTPWRRAYIEGSAANHAPGSDTGCFLCNIAAAAADEDRANFVLFRSERTYGLLNLYPYNTGHLMVAPYLHTGDLARLEPAIAEEIMRMTQRCVDVLQRAYRPDAFNLGMNLGRPAGAGVPDHLHMHVVPRWSGDTNFMTITANTKVLPESLDQTYDRLEPLFHA
jgi:ATP adenylyltransferase